jgi:hypothetical protein
MSEDKLSNQKKLSALMTRAWMDRDFRERLKIDPKKVLQEEGLDLPSGLDVKIIQNTQYQIYLVLPDLD